MEANARRELLLLLVNAESGAWEHESCMEDAGVIGRDSETWWLDGFSRCDATFVVCYTSKSVLDMASAYRGEDDGSVYVCVCVGGTGSLCNQPSGR